LPEIDGGAAPDGGALDGGATTDGGVMPDGGATLDGGGAADGGTGTDGGATFDGGATVDGGGTDDGGATIDGGGADGGADDGGAVPDGGAQDGGAGDGGVVTCVTPDNCPTCGTPCLARTCDSGVCGCTSVPDLTVTCDDGDATTWGDVCVGGACRGLFKASLWEPSTPVGNVVRTRLRGVHCDDVLSGAYAAGEFRGTLAGFSDDFGLVLQINRSAEPAVPGFSVVSAVYEPLLSIHGTGTAPPGVSSGGYVAVGRLAQLVWFSSIMSNQDSSVQSRRVGADSAFDYLSVWGWQPGNTAEIYVAGSMDFVRRCPFPPIINSCTTTIDAQGQNTSIGLTGAEPPSGTLPWLWSINAPQDNILYYPVLRESVNIFAYDVPQGCTPGGPGTPPCKFDGQFLDIFAAAHDAVWATATGNRLLHFDGNGWTRVTEFPGPVTTPGRDPLSAVFAKDKLVHVAGKRPGSTTSTLAYYVFDGDAWRGPIPLVSFPSAQTDAFQIDDAHGCEAHKPLLVGSANDANGHQKALVLAPMPVWNQLFP
jgi:hypothetical protein